MAEFLPDGSLYVFIGVASVLFSLTIGCFLYYKGKSYCRNTTVKVKSGKKGAASFKRATRRNKFLMKRGERADADEEGGGAEGAIDKIRAEIDAKYNNPSIWATEASADGATHDNEIREVVC